MEKLKISEKNLKKLSNLIACEMGSYKYADYDYPDNVILNNKYVPKIKKLLEECGVYSDDLFKKIYDVILRWLAQHDTVNDYRSLVQYLIWWVDELKDKIVED
ncbi:MAG: hypothetical protein HY813_03130 [Candidatus Portnoybacteria bacterium]|nr:hypothetical protein [Candidatus Portnoybacteria bacterium]